jgi:hypothetical protein
MGLLHELVSHVAPGAVQIPQLGLQHTMPELHVFGPHSTLSAEKLTLRGTGAPSFGDCTLLDAGALLDVAGAANTGAMTGAG